MGTETEHDISVRTDVGAQADSWATRRLFAATGAGALLGTAWHLAGSGDLPFLPQNWIGSQMAAFGAGIVAAVLVLAAWALTARTEHQHGIRRQRGALAALAGMAVLCIPFISGLVFSPFFGVALLLLALRTREVRTAAMGLTAAAAALVPAFFPLFDGAALILALIATAAFAVVVQLGRAPAGTSGTYSPR